MWSFAGLESVVSSGLGGGSLIYANVLIRKDERWFVKEDRGRPRLRVLADYPAGSRPPLRRGRGHARRPGAIPSAWPPTAAPRRHEPCRTRPPPSAWSGSCRSSRSPSPTTGRPPRPASASKANPTTSTTPPARPAGSAANATSDATTAPRTPWTTTICPGPRTTSAVIRTLAEVRRIDRTSTAAGYVVNYVQHDPEAGRRAGTSLTATVHADKLILAAGTFGSPYLLLRNRAAFPALSPALGTHFSGNGDLLTFISHARHRMGGLGRSIPASGRSSPAPYGCPTHWTAPGCTGGASTSRTAAIPFARLPRR